MLRRCIQLALTAATASVVACGSSTAGPSPAPSPDPAPDPQSRAAAVYESVLRALVRGDRTGSTRHTVVYVVDGAVPGAGDPTRQRIDTKPKQRFDSALKDRLTQQLAGLASVRFVERGTSVVVGRHGGSSPGHVAHRGVLMILGPIPRNRSSVRVGASSWRNGLDGHWQTYAVGLVDGHWAVTGTVGPVAIS